MVIEMDSLFGTVRPRTVLPMTVCSGLFATGPELFAPNSSYPDHFFRNSEKTGGNFSARFVDVFLFILFSL